MTPVKTTFPALACDYDGTLAVHDRMSRGTVDALGGARAAGIRVLLVTGRTLFELTRVCERLDLFDAVVAENGGVLYFPRDQALREEGPPPPPRLLEELDRRGVPFQTGHVVVATLHRYRDAVLDAVRAAEVTVELVENRAALMLLPPLISKGTGVRTALLALGLAPGDVLAIGDAENDLPLFDACGWSACPEDAVVEVKRRVDWILPGEAGDAVGRAITERIVTGKLPPPRHGRHFVHLGWIATTAEPVELCARGVNVLVHGDSLCGKSSFVGGLVERLAATRDAVCVIDPEGDYGVLGDLPGAHVVSVARVQDWEEIAETLAWSTPVVADLGGVPHAAQVGLVALGLARLHRDRERRGLPPWIVVDEAHYLLHGAAATATLVGLEAKGLCLVTYRASALPPAIVDAMDVFVVGRLSEASELGFVEHALDARGLPGPVVRRAAGDLATGTFVMARAGTPPVTFVPPPRAIRHVRHFTKYSDHDVAPHHAFFFRGPDAAIVAAAASLDEFVTRLGQMTSATVAHHATRGDFSRWIRDVFQDELLAARLAKLERRWCRGELPEFRREVAGLLAAAFANPQPRR